MDAERYKTGDLRDGQHGRNVLFHAQARSEGLVGGRHVRSTLTFEIHCDTYIVGWQR